MIPTPCGLKDWYDPPAGEFLAVHELLQEAWRCGHRTRVDFPATAIHGRTAAAANDGTIPVCATWSGTARVASASGGRCSSRKATNSDRNASTSASKVSCTALLRGRQRVHDIKYFIFTAVRAISSGSNPPADRRCHEDRSTREGICWTARRSSSPASRARSLFRSRGRWPGPTRCGAPRACATPADRDNLVAAGITPLPWTCRTGDFSGVPADFTYVFHAAVDTGIDDWQRCLDDECTELR